MGDTDVYSIFLLFFNESSLAYMTVTALRLEPGLEVECEGGVQVEVLHVDAQLEKKTAYRTVHCKGGHCHTKMCPQYTTHRISNF
jgi:hypothetical protein